MQGTRRAELGLIGTCYQNGAMKGKDAQENVLVFLKDSLRAQEQALLMLRKMGIYFRQKTRLAMQGLLSSSLKGI